MPVDELGIEEFKMELNKLDLGRLDERDIDRDVYKIEVLTMNRYFCDKLI